jgi:uncharacterized membrane protein
MNAGGYRSADEYLGRLRRSMGDLPAERRDEVVSGIEEHIGEMLAQMESTTDVDVRNALDRVGNPDDIAHGARERFGITPLKPRWTDTAAIILLPLGGVVLPVIGWLIAVVRPVWNARAKAIGTLIVPGGLLLPLGLLLTATSSGTCTTPIGRRGGARSCTDGMGSIELIVLACLLVAPVVTTVYLGRKLTRARAASD